MDGTHNVKLQFLLLKCAAPYTSNISNKMNLDLINSEDTGETSDYIL